MPDPEVVIVIPSQGSDLNAFDDSATTLSKKVYGGKALIVRSTVTPAAGDTFTVEFKTRDGTAFSFAGKTVIRRVLTISHAFSGDGPNLAYHAGGYQPWGIVDGLGTELTPAAKAFWTEVGKAMKPDGQVILLGCFMGAGEYGKLVARATDKPAYASTSLFAAGNADSAVKYVTAIEGGKAPSPMKKFDPVKPSPAPAPSP